jgi:high-affinity Fe2+/Pb2+ permease
MKKNTMTTLNAPPAQPGQDKRLTGSLLLPLAAGVMLDTSYQWTGITILLVAVVLVSLGWREHWQDRESKSS